MAKGKETLFFRPQTTISLPQRVFLQIAVDLALSIAVIKNL